MKNLGAIVEAPGGAIRTADWTVAPDDDDVVLAVELCGLCGSDVHTYKGESGGAAFPVLMGHEYVGRIQRLPDGLTDVLGRPLCEGDRVVAASAVFGECGRCRWCALLGAPWLCVDRERPHIEVDGHNVRVAGGGFARLVHLTGRRSRQLLRADVSAEAASLYEPLTIAVQMVMGGPPVLGADVVVQGTGAIGLMTILVARAAGAATVIGVGGPAARLRVAQDFGADVVVNITQVRAAGERASIVRAATIAGAGAGVSYEIAGVPQAVTEGLSYLGPSGVLMEAGNAADTGTVELNPSLDVQSFARRVVGVRGRTLRDFVVAGRLMERFAEQLAPLVSHILPLSRLGEGMDALAGDYELDGAPVLKIAISPN